MESKSNSFTKTFSIDLERENYRNNVKKGRKTRFLIVLFFWMVIISFLFTPYARAANFNVNGNSILSDKTIISNSNIKNSQLILIDPSIVEEDLKKNKGIIDVRVVKKVGKISIEITELTPLGFIDNALLLNNGVKTTFEDYYFKDKVEKESLANIEIEEEDFNIFYLNFSKISFDSIVLMEHIKIETIETEKVVDVLFKTSDIGYFIVRADLNHASIQLNFEQIKSIQKDIINTFGEEKHSKNSPVLVEYISVDLKKYTLTN